MSQLRGEEGEVGLKFETIDVDVNEILDDLGANVNGGDLYDPQLLDNYQFPSEEAPQYLGTQGTDIVSP